MKRLVFLVAITAAMTFSFNNCAQSKFSGVNTAPGVGSAATPDGGSGGGAGGGGAGGARDAGTTTNPSPTFHGVTQ